MKRYLLIAYAALAFAGSANAQNPANMLANDVSAILGNLQPASQTFAAGLQDTASQLSTAAPAQNTADALSATVSDTNAALVNGTTDQYSLRSGVSLIAQNALRYGPKPLLQALDNPTAGNFETLQNAFFSPNQVTEVAENLQPALNAVWRGHDGFFSPNGDGGKQALLDLLDGNLAAGGFFNTGGAVQSASTALLLPAQLLLAPTIVGKEINATLTVANLASGNTTAVNDLLVQIDGPLGQLTDAAAPLTGPTSDLIEATEFDPGSLDLPSADTILAAYGDGSL